MLLILLNVIYRPVKVYRYVRTSVRVYTSYIFIYVETMSWSYTCWRWHLLHCLSVNIKSKL